MALETILWTALIVAVSMAIGWILGIFYDISRMKAKRRRRLNKETDEGDRLPEVLGERAFHEKVVKIVNSAAELGELKISSKILIDSDPEIEIVTHGDPRDV